MTFEDPSRQYYRYEPAAKFGTVASPECNVLYRANGKEVLVGCLEGITCWNLRTGTVTGSWSDADNKSAVVRLAVHPGDGDVLAAGYEDGSIRIWNLKTGEVKVTFRGHKTAVTALCFDALGARLVSGARDTNIVLWDLASECGLHRLSGHNNAITLLAFLTDNHIVSSSKDSMMKLWDLQALHCIETIVTHPAEVAGFIFTSDKSMMLTAGADQFLRLFKIDHVALENKLKSAEGGVEADGISSVFTFYGEVQRSSRDRALQISVYTDESQSSFGVLSSDKSIELFKYATVEDVKKKLNRRKKRLREKGQEGEAGDVEEAVLPSDMIKSIHLFRPDSRARSFDFKVANPPCLVIGTVVNTVEEMEIDFKASTAEWEPRLGLVIDLPGHRSEAKVVAVSGDGSMIMSASRESIKIWNSLSGTCIRTMDCSDVLSACFIRNNEYLLAGTKDGQLRVFELSSGAEVEPVSAHHGAIWSIAMRPDRKGFCTGSADKTVKFWEFKGSADRAEGFRLKNVRTLQVSEDVLCVKYSPDCRYVAVSLLDLTVKVFFEDTLKFYLSLFGHKLPVMSIDISHDGKLIATASADKNVKIWGLDFGDCHKSIFAHQEAITAAAFLPRTYQLMTASKDGCIKYWTDEQEWSMLQKLEGHHAEIWSLAVAPRGEFVVSVSGDRSIRVFRRTEEPLFLEEEKERQTEEMIEASILAGNPHSTAERNDEIGPATQKSLDSLRASERIVDAIEAADEETEMLEEWENAKRMGLNPQEPVPGPYFQTVARGKTPAQFVMSVFEGIPIADLDLALLGLSTDQVKSLFKYINWWLEGSINISLTSAILRGIININYTSIVADERLRVQLEGIRRLQKQKLAEFRDLLGLNAQVMKSLMRHYDQEHAKIYN